MSNKRPFSIVINDEHGHAKAKQVIANLKVTPGSPVEVVIRPYKATRSQQQNATYWMWIADIADEEGSTKDDVSLDMKRMFLKPLLERTDEKFAEIMCNLRNAYRDGHRELAQQIELGLMLELSTTRLNVTQMNEYMNSIQDYANKRRITLRIPPDSGFKPRTTKK